MFQNLKFNFSALLQFIRCSRTNAYTKTDINFSYSAKRILIFVTMVVLAMLFVDPSINNISAKIPTLVLNFFIGITDIGKSEYFLVPSILLITLALIVNYSQIGDIPKIYLNQLTMRCAYIFTSFAFTGLIVLFLKIIIGRARPKLFDELGIFAFDPFSMEAVFRSLPSGHTATAATMMICFGLLFPAFRIGFVILAILIGLSRIFIGAHYPSDVIAGFFIGFYGSKFVALEFAKRKWLFHQTLNQELILRENSSGFLNGLKVLWRAISIQILERKTTNMN